MSEFRLKVREFSRMGDQPVATETRDLSQREKVPGFSQSGFERPVNEATDFLARGPCE